MDLFFTFILNIFRPIYQERFLKLLLIDFLICTEVFITTSEVFHSKSYSAQFDSVELLDLIMVGFISNKPKSIIWFLLCFTAFWCVIKIEPFLILFDLTKNLMFWLLWNILFNKTFGRTISFPHEICFKTFILFKSLIIGWLSIEETMWISFPCYTIEIDLRL